MKGPSAAREEQIDPLYILGLDNVTLHVPNDAEEIARYCVPLIAVQFSGQICAADKKVQNLFILVFFIRFSNFLDF